MEPTLTPNSGATSAMAGQPWSPAEDADYLAALRESASLPLQSLAVEPTDDGWRIVVGSPVESGAVTLLVPRLRDRPVQILSDTRAASEKQNFEELYARGHYEQAAFVAAERLLAHSGAADADRLTLLRQLSQAYLRTGNYHRAELLLTEALQLCERLPADSVDQQDVVEQQVRLLHDSGLLSYLYKSSDEDGYGDAAQQLIRARLLAETKLGPDHPELARILTSQARLRIAEFNYVEADRLLQQAVAICERTRGPRHRDISDALLERARLATYREDAAAEELFQQAQGIREEQLGPDTPDVADVLFHFADFLVYNRRQPERAAPLLERATQIWQQTVGLQHPLIQRETEFIHKVLNGELATADNV